MAAGIEEQRTDGARRLVLEIFLVSFAALLLEINYTRVFSFKISSYYTYLVLGFALLGIGAGAVFVAILPRMRSVPAERLLPPIALAGALLIGVGYLVVSGVELSTYAALEFAQIWRLALVCGVLLVSFLAFGLIIALIFTSRSERIHTLYGADLAGAGVGCAAAVPLMVILTPPGSILASAAALAVVGVLTAWAESRRGFAGVGLALTLVLGTGAVCSDFLPDPVVDAGKTMGAGGQESWEFRSIFHRWNPYFRVDVLESPHLPGRRAIAHDGDWGSVLWEFDGSKERLQELFAADTREFPFAVAAPNPRVLIIGSAGGNEILATLHFDAESTTAVELNPVTVSLLEEHFADFTGHLPEHESVTLVNAEGRSFLSRDENEYDIIYFVAPDSYAAMSAAQASGFVLVESYLYTVEMVKEAIGHLRPGGTLCMQFGEVDFRRKPNRTARYLSTARQAFRELGIEDFSRHVLLATTPEFPVELATILLRPTPFSDEEIQAFEAVAAKVPDTVVRHTPHRVDGRGLTSRVITSPDRDLELLFERYAYDVRPVVDDAPFFWHFARFRDVIVGRDRRLRNPIDREDGKGEEALLIMLGVSVAFAAVFLLLPFAVIRERWRRLPHKSRSAVYFASLGLGFMFYEIALLQKLTLFLGSPTYSLTVTLFSLLVFTGVGSLLSARFASRRDRVLPWALLAVAALTLFYQFGLDAIKDALVANPLPARVLLTVLMVAPLGLTLGVFMPLGLATIAQLTPLRGEYIAWGWAVNGVFSVIASMLATILSMSYGFRTLLFIALGLYALATVTLRALPPPRDS